MIGDRFALAGLRVVGTGRVDCFIIGNDGRIYHTYSDQASSGDHRDFSPWIEEPTPPPDGLDLGAGLAVTAWGVGRLYLGCGRGGALTFDWYGWDSVGRPKD